MNMRTIKSELSTDIVYHEEEQYTEKQLIETSYFAARDYIIHETGIYKLAKSNPAKDKKLITTGLKLQTIIFILFRFYPQWI